jgi:hypothetical protein
MESQTKWMFLKRYLTDLERDGKEGWLNDGAATKCFKCYNLFTFSRRRHHCRMCGNIFCKDCCFKRSIDSGKEIKYVRSCEKCHKLLQGFTGDIQQTIEEIRYNQIVQHLSSYKLTYRDSKRLADLNEEEKGEQKPLLSMEKRKVEKIQEEHIRGICKRLCEESKIPDEYEERIEEMVLRAVSTVKPSVTIKDDLTFKQYVKVKLMPGKDISYCRYVNGVVFTKNVADKKMKTNIADPLILLISGDLAENKDELEMESFKEVLNQEGHFSRKLMHIIQIIKPSVIVVEKTVSVPILELLRDQNITVVISY